MGATDVVEVKLIVTGACRLVRGAAREAWNTIMLGIRDLESMNTSCLLNEKFGVE